MNIKSILGAIAPTIATAIGGPFGGIAAQFALDKLGITVGSDPAGQLETLVKTADPTMLLRLKEIDNEFVLKMEELGVKREELLYKDIDSARSMAKVNMMPQIVISVIYNIGYFIIMGYIISNAVKGTLNIPGDAQLLIGSLLGVLTAELPRINAFWFGSSSGSKDKTAEMTTKKAAK